MLPFVLHNNFRVKGKHPLRDQLTTPLVSNGPFVQPPSVELQKDQDKNVSHCHLVHRKSHIDFPGRKPGLQVQLLSATFYIFESSFTL